MTAGACGDARRKNNNQQGDVIAGLLLSQIVYYYLPDKKGNPNKLRVSKKGKQWIAKQLSEWWEEIRISEKQASRAIQILCKLNLIEVDYFRFNGLRTMHIALNEATFIDIWEHTTALYTSSEVTKRRHREGQKGAFGDDKMASPLTENTAKNTTETTIKRETQVGVTENGSLSPKENGDFQNLLSSLKDISRPSTKRNLEDAARSLADRGVKAEELSDFKAWWQVIYFKSDDTPWPNQVAQSWSMYKDYLKGDDNHEPRKDAFGVKAVKNPILSF